jgi:hypothetical protein
MPDHRHSIRAAVVDEARTRPAEWLRRYGLAEFAGLVLALAAGWVAHTLAAHGAVIAYAATVFENVGFYGTIAGRQVAADRRAAVAAHGAYARRHVGRTVRELLIEFGPAELLDSLILRPLAMGIGVRMLGLEMGIIAGKVAADVTFYLPVILTYELRRKTSPPTAAP